MSIERASGVGGCGLDGARKWRRASPCRRRLSARVYLGTDGGAGAVCPDQPRKSGNPTTAGATDAFSGRGESTVGSLPRVYRCSVWAVSYAHTNMHSASHDPMQWSAVDFDSRSMHVGVHGCMDAWSASIAEITPGGDSPVTDSETSRSSGSAPPPILSFG